MRVSVGLLLLAAPGLLVAQSIPDAWFELREMDMHLHGGLEREPDMKSWIDLSVRDGRKVFVLLDHLELYRKSAAELDLWRKGRKFDGMYPMASAGHSALMADFDKVAAQRQDAIFFKAWEVYEGELDTGIESAPMGMVDLIGWHISPNNGREAPNGRKMIERVRQILELQKQMRVPMILFHPFTMRIENLQRTAQAAGRDPKSLTVAEYRYFQPGEQEQLARLLRGSSVYVEISHSTDRYFEDPVCREALIADTKPLADMGVQFTVSTDAHGARSFDRAFEPKRYCDALGVTPQNTNTLVRDLLVMRAKRGIKR